MKTAIFTITKDDPFLALWWNYYKRHHPKDDIFILNNGGPLPTNSNNIIECPHPEGLAFDHDWLREQVQEFQTDLLSRYDWVVFTETDELLVPMANERPLNEPLGEVLKSVCEASDVDVLVPQSRDILHDPFNEPPLNGRPSLKQRGWWEHRLCMDKPIISRAPLQWNNGFHSLAMEPEPSMKRSVNLMLLHFHRVDYGTAKIRAEARSKMQWSPKDLVYGVGKQNRLVGEEFETFFFDGMMTNAHRIPEEWRIDL